MSDPIDPKARPVFRGEPPVVLPFRPIVFKKPPAPNYSLLFALLGMILWFACSAGTATLINYNYLPMLPVGVWITIFCVTTVIAYLIWYRLKLPGFIAGYWLAFALTALCPFTWILVVCGGVIR